MTRLGILIHGTFAGPKAGVKQWYDFGSQEEGSFINRLEAALRKRGDPAPITWHVFSWSGANTHSDRLLAAEALYRLIEDVLQTSPGGELLLLAHSHGGNVALKALELLWRRNPEGQRAFRALIRALGIERIRHTAAPAHIIASFTEPPKISDPLRKFLEGAAFVIQTMLRLHGLPRMDADSATQEKWMERMGRSPLISGLQEAFCVRWSAERRPLVHLLTMGTPFFHKIWNPQPLWSGRAWLARIATAGVIAAVICGLASLVAISGIPQTKSGLVILAAWSVISLSLVILGLFFRSFQRRGDTNVYFNISQAYGEDPLRPAKLPWRLSIIQAGLLDEALLLLSAEPLIFAELAPRLEKPLTPALSWRLPPGATGEETVLVPMSVQFISRTFRRGAALAVRWTYNVTIGFTLRLFGWIATVTAHRFLLRTLLRTISSGGFGIPEHEFNEARLGVIAVPMLETFFALQVWDATQALVEEAPPRPTAADRRAKWAFLWDDKQLQIALSSSQIWERMRTRLSALVGNPGGSKDEQRLQRLSLALEERLREASGLVPLNHSGYYTNGQVITKVAEFLTSVN